MCVLLLVPSERGGKKGDDESDVKCHGHCCAAGRSSVRRMSLFAFTVVFSVHKPTLARQRQSRSPRVVANTLGIHRQTTTAFDAAAVATVAVDVVV